jgi:4-hydroxy-2-oxoglutarate aldolase
MVDGTRHIKRQTTVTETFDAVTLRMLKAAVSASNGSRELVSVEALAGSSGADTRVHESSGRKPSSSEITTVGSLKTRQKEVGFQVMVGAAHQLEPSLALGAAGAILAFACPAPTACYEIYAALKESDTEVAREKQDRIKQAAQRVVSDLGVPGVKYAMDLNGYYGGPSRLPFLPLTGEQKVEVERLMAHIRN